MLLEFLGWLFGLTEQKMELEIASVSNGKKKSCIIKSCGTVCGVHNTDSEETEEELDPNEVKN